MKTTFLSLLACAGLLASGLAQEDDPVAAVEELVTPDSIGAHIEFLSHDLLEGRGPGTRGDALTRLYLRSQYRLHGLEPAGVDGTFEQPVTLVGIKSTVLEALRIEGPEGDEAVFTAPMDYVTFAGRPEERVGWEDAEIVFVGYGIDAPEENWDDYGDADLEGKVLLVMNNDPSDDPDLFAGETRLYYGRWSYKYEEAARRGAVGAIVIHTTPSAGYPFQVIQSGHGQEDFWLPFDEETPTLAVRSWCSEDAARKITELGGHDLDQLRSRAESRDFRPVPLGVTANLLLENEIEETESANVLGILSGSDPELADTYVVVTAHFDHLGIGPPVRGDAIYNGAMDNASGTAALLELARAISHLEERPKRSILFTAVTAEESGLLGSLHFARNPTVPRRAMVANFNVDGLNIYGPTEDISLIGYGKNTLTDAIGEVATSRGRKLLPNPDVDKGLFYRSDHFSFARIGVPSVFFKSGKLFHERREAKQRVKRMYTATRYHQPSDEYDSRWNLNGAAEDVRLILEALVRVADDPEEPRWAPGDEFEKLR